MSESNLIRMQPNEIQNDKQSEIVEAITLWLDRVGQNSINTKKAYQRAIKEFFLVTRKKEIEELTVDDLQYTLKEVEKYQVAMRKKSKTTTVNSKMSAIKRCFEKLSEYDFPVKPSWFNVERYKEFDKKSYDPMTHDEIVQAINIVSQTIKGREKALLIRMAYATAFRKDSLCKLRFKDIVDRDGVKYVKTLGKGQEWDYKKLSSELYDAIMEHKNIVNRKDDRIFTLQPETISDMLKLICEKIDFGDRRIVFHSLKKSSIDEVAIITNYDLKAMQAQGNHSNVATTLNDYMRRKQMDEMVTVDINFNVPVEKFDEMTKEELVEMLKKTDRNVQIKLLNSVGAI